MSVPILNMSNPTSMKKGKRPTLIPESLKKMARTALIYPVRFVGSTATGGVEFSPTLYAFNGLVVIAAVIFGYVSLLGELMSFRKGQSVRFENVPVAVIACFKFTMLVLPSVIAVFGSVSRHAAWLDVERLMDRVDEALDSRSCAAVDKRVERLALWVICLQVVMFAADYCTWLTINPNNKSYGIVYLFSYINVASLIIYAQLAWCIGHRFDVVNRRIEATLERLTSTNRVEFSNRQCQDLSYLLYCLENRVNDIKLYMPIKKIQEIHWNLCYCVNILNNQYGWYLLTSLLLNIINLIAYPNILQSRISNKALLEPLKYGFSIVSTVELFCCQLANLFLMVLPASYAALKAESTVISVCKYLNIYLVPNDMKQSYVLQLELFLLQLNQHKVCFSIFGIVDLRRSTITKVIGTTISYFLIFIQLQNTY